MPMSAKDSSPFSAGGWAEDGARLRHFHPRISVALVDQKDAGSGQGAAARGAGLSFLPVHPPSCALLTHESLCTAPT